LSVSLDTNLQSFSYSLSVFKVKFNNFDLFCLMKVVKIDTNNGLIYFTL